MCYHHEKLAVKKYTASIAMRTKEFFTMSYTVPVGFQKLHENVEITNIQASTVSTRQQNVRDAVRKRLLVDDDFLTGSYMRNTMIAPLKDADVDIFMVMNDVYYRSNGQAYILDKVRDVLIETYPSTPKISRDGQAVTISFSDFKVDVVPAFTKLGGGYYIPNTITKQWVATDPRRHIALWSEENKAHNGKLVPLIKMMKAWNKDNSSLFNSFHLECLILQTMKYVPITEFYIAVRHIFEKSQYSFQSVYDPIMFSSVSTYLNTQEKRNAASSKLNTAYTWAKKAEDFAGEGKIKDAYYYWRLLFGNYFPVYR